MGMDREVEHAEHAEDTAKASVTTKAAARPPRPPIIGASVLVEPHEPEAADSAAGSFARMGRATRGLPIPVQLRRRARSADEEVPVDAGWAPTLATTVCLAPSMMLYLDPSGDVRPCCKNNVAIGNVGRTRLTEIWWGANRALLEKSVEAGDFSQGCVQCEAEMGAEGRDLVYPANFDRYEPDLAPTRSERWPLRMEFNLSNSCNLQCIQCNGLLSSSIRLHREHQPPLPKVYGDQFFEDLELFIPHLVDAQFAGGEPFMAAESYRVWDMIARLNPELPCTTVTNATQWNRRIQEVLETLVMGFVFSIDGVTKDTYEAVRIGADFESVMANVERYAAIARSHELPLEVNYCQMLQNYHGLADVLRWAEERGMHVNVSVVRDPPSCSLAAADDAVLAEALALYERQYDAVAADLDLNLEAWEREVVRIRRWLEAGDEGRIDLWGEANYLVERRHTRATRAVTRFYECTSGLDVCRTVVDDRGQIAETNGPMAELAGIAIEDLIGRDMRTAAFAMFEHAFGSEPELEPLITTPECQELDAIAGDSIVRVLAVPTPGLDGRTRTTTVLMCPIDPELRGTPFVNAADWPTA
jgi:radical SAM protein with 4Fe4S-binding SPASM domain